MITKWPGNTPEEQNQAMQRAFRRVFGSEEGIAVLNVILNDLHYFTPCSSTEDNALCNYAKVLINERMDLTDTVRYTDLLVKSKDEVKGE